MNISLQIFTNYVTLSAIYLGVEARLIWLDSPDK